MGSLFVQSNKAWTQAWVELCQLGTVTDRLASTQWEEEEDPPSALSWEEGPTRVGVRAGAGRGVPGLEQGHKKCPLRPMQDSR